MSRHTSLVLGEVEIHWLHGGSFRLDGGAMFGAVPKTLWGKQCSVDSENTVLLCNDPLLVRTPQSLVLVDTGLGNKLTAKQKAIYRVATPWDVPGELKSLGYNRRDVTHVVLTHGDFDHAGGVAMVRDTGRLEMTFPNARHFLQKTEWEDIAHPHPRAKSVYLEEDFTLLRNSRNLELLDGPGEISPGVVVRFSGGHTRGHQVVEIDAGSTLAVHLGDLFPTHFHSKPLWTMAYDNYPLEVIRQKGEYFSRYAGQNSWFTFYHDPLVRACRLDAVYQITETWPPPDPPVSGAR